MGWEEGRTTCQGLTTYYALCELILNDNERSQACATRTLLCSGWKILLDSTVDSKISIQD